VLAWSFFKVRNCQAENQERRHRICNADTNDKYIELDGIFHATWFTTKNSDNV
jgi:hypothetical protein